MQKSTGPAPAASPLSRASAAIEGLCAAVLRNNEVTLPDKWTSVSGRPVRGHGPPLYTEADGAPFNRCEESVPAPSGSPAAYASKECTVDVR
ncbi:hypothetical protein GCM10010330_18010 [Streptomyces tendae]|nr:hypothetical protein GCM10010330_18010 [Streptomyces tendae]